MQPDELAVIMGSSIKKKHVNASDYILWTGLLKLDATPLSAVFKRLENVCMGVKLAYPEEMESMKLYGSLDLMLIKILRRIV